jgi:hypothetical protein
MSFKSCFLFGFVFFNLFSFCVDGRHIIPKKAYSAKASKRGVLREYFYSLWKNKRELSVLWFKISTTLCAVIIPIMYKLGYIDKIGIGPIDRFINKKWPNFFKKTSCCKL